MRRAYKIPKVLIAGELVPDFPVGFLTQPGLQVAIVAYASDHVYVVASSWVAHTAPASALWQGTEAELSALNVTFTQGTLKFENGLESRGNN